MRKWLIVNILLSVKTSVKISGGSVSVRLEVSPSQANFVI